MEPSLCMKSGSWLRHSDQKVRWLALTLLTRLRTISQPTRRRAGSYGPLETYLSLELGNSYTAYLRKRDAKILACRTEGGGGVVAATVGTPVPRRPPYRPGRAVFRIRFLGCTRVRAGQNRCQLVSCFAIPRREVGSCGSGPTVSGISFLCGLRTSVTSFPV